MKMHASACPHLENIRIMTREVRLWVLGYARGAIWTLESAKKIIHRQHLDRTVGTNSVLLFQLTVARRIPKYDLTPKCQTANKGHGEIQNYK